MKELTYLIYIILFEGLVWLGGFYLILEKGWSCWWILLIIFISASAYKPNIWMV